MAVFRGFLPGIYRKSRRARGQEGKRAASTMQTLSCFLQACPCSSGARLSPRRGRQIAASDLPTRCLCGVLRPSLRTTGFIARGGVQAIAGSVLQPHRGLSGRQVTLGTPNLSGSVQTSAQLWHRKWGTPFCGARSHGLGASVVSCCCAGAVWSESSGGAVRCGNCQVRRHQG